MCETPPAFFDVSHMGQIELVPTGSDLRAVALALESLVPADIAGLAVGAQQYTVFTNSGGGIEDDLMVANLGDRLLLVVNASRKEEDLERLGPLSGVCAVSARL